MRELFFMANVIFSLHASVCSMDLLRSGVGGAHMSENSLSVDEKTGDTVVFLVKASEVGFALAKDGLES